MSFYTPPSPVATQRAKKHLEISSFYTSVQKILIICYTVPEIWHATHVVVIFHFELFLLPFWAIFCLFISPTAQKIKISKKQNKKKKTEKKPTKNKLEISLFYTCVPKIMISWCTVLEILRATDDRMDERTDGQIDGKSDIQRWMHHLKNEESSKTILRQRKLKKSTHWNIKPLDDATQDTPRKLL